LSCFDKQLARFVHTQHTTHANPCWTSKLQNRVNCISLQSHSYRSN